MATARSSWRCCDGSGCLASVRVGRGPDRVLADKAYAGKANRAYLRRLGIRATIPIKADHAANRRKLGSKGGRPPTFDPELYEATVTITAINEWLRPDLPNTP